MTHQGRVQDGKRYYDVTLDGDEMEYIHNALASYLESQSELAKGEHEIPLLRQDETGMMTETGEKLDMSDVFVAQYVDVKALRKKLVEVVGHDLTVDGQ